jgi:hypothetical protein
LSAAELRADDLKQRDQALLFQAERNARRIDPDHSMALGIYRDMYERKPKQEIPGVSSYRTSCVRRVEDDPELMDAFRSQIAKFDQKNGTSR